MKGRLFLIPTLIADETAQAAIPATVRDVVRGIEYFLCENVRTARRFIGSLKVHTSIEALRFELLNKDTRAEDLDKLFEPVHAGNDAGVLSESGCPGVADPGALAVRYAHDNAIRVVPLVGPSSILLALAASGMNGQQFAFHGYLPVNAQKAALMIKKLEQESQKKKQTQIFIETPYRNNALLGHFLAALRPDSTLCVACNLTSPEERIISRRVSDWKKQPETFPKAPAVFLFVAAY